MCLEEHARRGGSGKGLQCVLTSPQRNLLWALHHNRWWSKRCLCAMCNAGSNEWASQNPLMHDLDTTGAGGNEWVISLCATGHFELVQ